MSGFVCFKRRYDFLWQVLVGLTFVSCTVFIYHFLIHEGILHPYHSHCSTSQMPSADGLSREKCDVVCNTKECIDISNFILSNMNQSANPCDDFYNFACGNFEERFKRDGNHSILDQLTVELHLVIKDVIEKSDVIPGSATSKLKIVYESCMNTGSSEFTAVKTILQFLKHMGIPNWPHLNANFTFKAPTLPEILGRLSAYQEDVFVQFFESYHHSQKENEHLHILTPSPQQLTFHEEEEIKDIKKVISGILKYAGVDHKDAQKMLVQFIKVDKEINKLVLNNSYSSYECEEENATRESSYECKQSTHKNKNDFMLCRVLESVVRNGRIASRYDKDNLYIMCTSKYYINRIFDLILKYDDRVIANYIALRVFINNVMYMNFSVRKHLKYLVKLPPDSEEYYVTELDKWQFCVSWIADNMKYPLGMMYVSSMWPNKSTDEVNDIFKQYMQATKTFISQQRWIADSTKEQILKEIDEVENCIYYVIQGMQNQTKINSLYRKFYPVRTSFMRNVFSHKKFMFIASKLNSDDMNYFVEYSPFVVNAYGGDNIYLTFGILLPPVYKYGYPNLFNIAKIGQIMGHEIGHKLFYFFEYSEDLDNRTRETFEKKNECLINQYFNFELKQIKKFVQGNMTVSENFPDNVGLRVTEKVSQIYLREMESTQFSLPGLPFSADELLYISYAQMWCSVRSIEKQMEHYERDSHSPPEFRIKGTFQNSRRFSEVFNCSHTSFMNPKKKCSVLD